MSARIFSRSGLVGSRKWLLTAVALSLSNLPVAGQVTDQSGARIAGAASALVGDQTGVVKSANQPIPGAVVSATQGTTIVVTTTDQNGHYSLQLGQGVWGVEVTMGGFQPARKRLTVSNSPPQLDFTFQLTESPLTPRLSGSPRARP